MRSAIVAVLLIFSAAPLAAQQPYELKKFSTTVTKNIKYGSDTAFDGRLTDLYLDLYKPVGDSNCKRPVMVMVHGGAWLGGDKAGGALPALCNEFAARGYVVASINYRMGMHPASYYVPYALCVHEKCSYVADSAEWYRALFRAMQDTKSAVRFMKSRSASDSTDNENVYLGGESAGAYTAMYAGWTDQNSEKPSQCYALSDAPIADADLAACVIANPVRKRPDMGSIDGNGNPGPYDSKVKGVAAFYGGVLDTSIFRQASGADTPVLYNFHQTCDVVVDPNKGRIFWKVFYYCYAPLNLCMPFSTGPISWGSTAIKQHIDSMKGPRPKQLYKINTTGGPYSCDPNSNCHGIDNIQQRCAEIAAFFAPVIASSGNVPGKNQCFSAVEFINNRHNILFYPNPASNCINISVSPSCAAHKATCILEGMDGKTIFSVPAELINLTCTIQLPDLLKTGLYVLKYVTSEECYTQNVLIIRN